MKLCAGILYWGLKEELKTVELHGAGSQELTLSRPEFYLDRTKTFERNRVYVCSADHLPARPSLSANVCLVCLGQHWNLNGFYDRCSVIVVEADTDIFRVFNLVQHILTGMRHGRNGCGISFATAQACRKCWRSVGESLKTPCCSLAQTSGILP